VRITYVLNGLGVCGGVRVIFEHCNRLTKRGHDVQIAVTDDIRWTGWFPLEVQVRPWMYVVHEPIDVLVATEWSTAPRVHLSPAGEKKFYFVQMRESLFTSHGSWAKSAEETYSLPLSPVTISKWLKSFLESEYGHRDVPIVPNGVNREMFYPDPAYPKTPGVHRIIIEGHEANAAKNVRDAHAAVQVLKNMGLKVEVWGFNQLGPGRYRYDRFFQNPPQDEIRRIYSSGDVLLKSSRLEGRGCVGVEAMACGLPVVHTECRGTDDLIDGYNCKLVHYGNQLDIAKAAREILQNEELKENLVDNGLRYVERELNWEQVIDRLERIYAEPANAQYTHDEAVYQGDC
jgi:glycosyltransferase involved in cell wall biosynthesis